MFHVTIEPISDLPSLARRWRALEAVTKPSFFQSWIFLGCLAEQRLAGAQLLAIAQDGQDAGLAILGRARDGVWLNQTGSPVMDAIFIEHNGILAIPEAASHISQALIAASRLGTVHLSGIDDTLLATAAKSGWLQARQSRRAPSVNLQSLSGPYLDTLSANARAQIRRSLRAYGPEIALSPARTLEEAKIFLTEMIAVHQAAWQARGRTGAFATAHMREFHTELVARAWPSRQADLLRITAGPRHLGTLYNLIGNGAVHCYQSGFSYSDDAREKPGLSCHALAIEHYAANGAREYDLMAGADRYKLTLAQGGRMLHWAVLHRPWSARGVREVSVSFFKDGVKKLGSIAGKSS